jgi:hypothetical protein
MEVGIVIPRIKLAVGTNRMSDWHCKPLALRSKGTARHSFAQLWASASRLKRPAFSDPEHTSGTDCRLLRVLRAARFGRSDQL